MYGSGSTRSFGRNDARVLASAVVLSVVVVTVGCSRAPSGSSAQPAALTAAGTQALSQGVSVSCAAGQKALMRQQVVQGQPVVDVQCVPAVEQAPAPQSAAALDRSAAPVAMPYQGAANQGGPDFVTTLDEVRSRPRGPVRARPASYRDEGGVLTYEPRTTRRVKSGRSWQKSAVIIGSSAGVGAGIGAALGGKKGALIGAAIGGGGATIFDQASRRR